MEKDDQILGKKIGQIEITDKVGEGGMGAVYKGMHNFLGKEVAVKFLSKSLVENKEFIDRFIREAQTLARVEHKNLVRVYDAGEWEGNYYIVMEFIKGQSLGDILKSKARVPVNEAINIIRESAEGLKAAAEQSIIHRDIKPDNIMLLDKGNIKLTDFGLAKSLESAMEITQTGQLMGTPHYMSPEQCDGVDVDFRSDMYSLGATFYRVITGKFPYSGNTAFAVMKKHMDEPLTPPSSILTDIPEDVSIIIEKMMAKQPEDRFASYDVLCESLTAAEKGIPLASALGETIPEMPAHTDEVGNAPTIVGEATPIPSGGYSDSVGTAPTLVQSPKKKKLVWAAAGTLVIAVAVIGIVLSNKEKDIPEKKKSAVTEKTEDPVKPGPDKKEPVTVKTSADNASEAFKKAVGKFSNGNLDDAVTFFNAIITNYPTSEFADQASSYIRKIDGIKKGLVTVEELIKEFNISEAESVFKSLKLDIKKNIQWDKIFQKISELKGPVSEINGLYSKGKGLFEKGSFDESIKVCNQAISKAELIGYDTVKFKTMIKSSENGKNNKQFNAMAGKVKLLLNEFRQKDSTQKLLDATSELNKAQKTLGQDPRFKELKNRIDELKKADKDIRKLHSDAKTLALKGKYQEALDVLDNAKETATRNKCSLTKLDLTAKGIKVEKRNMESHNKSMADAEKGITDKKLETALASAKQAVFFKDTKQAQSLVDRITKLIKERDTKFKTAKENVAEFVEKKEYNDALKLISSMSSMGLTPEQQTYIRKKKTEIKDIIASAEKRGKGGIIDAIRGAKMALIPEGRIIVGNNSGPKPCRPEHIATISAFYIDVKEVTNKEYELFASSHKAKRLEGADGEDMPVTNITWEEADAYCRWLTKKEGAVYRLPTEAEWEKAAKGGQNLKYSSGSDYKGKIRVDAETPVPFDAYLPNPYGLYNMSGNVWEFCQDWVGIYSDRVEKDPVNRLPGKLKAKVTRGGSFSMKRADMTATTYFRNGVSQGKSYRDTGFRCVREVE